MFLPWAGARSRDLRKRLFQPAWFCDCHVMALNKKKTMQWWKRTRWQSKLVLKTRLPYSSSLLGCKKFFCCCLISVYKKIRSFIALDIRKVSRLYYLWRPEKNTVCGKIRVMGQMRQRKCQTVRDRYPHSGLICLPFMSTSGVAGSLWALCYSICLQDVERMFSDGEVKILNIHLRFVLPKLWNLQC